MRFLDYKHMEAIGEIRERNPWISDSWTLGPFHVEHWQNLRTPDICSVSSPRHVWTLYIRRTTVRFLVKYGLAPYLHTTEQ